MVSLVYKKGKQHLHTKRRLIPLFFDMKQYSTLILLLTMFSVLGQERMTATFGTLSESDLALTSYEEDPDANAVVLFESGTYKIESVNLQIMLIETIHRKIKIFDASKFEDDIITIYCYKSGNSNEQIKNIKAITHNGKTKQYVAKDDIFDVNISENNTAKRFTFPNIKDGSIIEYTYRKETPFFFSLDGWKFQKNIPVLYSEMYSEIIGNYIYNKSLYGLKKLYINESRIKKNCFSLAGYSQNADCVIGLYAMKNVSAFKEEAYMLAKENYISRIDFELREYSNLRGEKSFFSKTWKDVDKEFKTDKDLGRQLNNKSFFETALPSNILTINDPLERAKAIYGFIKNHFTWNGKYRLFNDIRVRDAYKERVGNNSEINLALVNALQAANLDAHMAISSTRENGLPSPEYPVITDFNYVTAHLNIEDTSYVLDATRKHNTFFVIPYELLNLNVRVMDFKKGSYWQEIIPYKNNTHYINAKIKADENGFFKGSVSEIKTGYLAVNENNIIHKASKNEYLKEKTQAYNNAEISNVVIVNDTPEKVTVNYDFTSEEELVGNKVFFNPYFFNTYFTKSPFSLNERSYPIDFGHPLRNTYLVNIDLNKLYEVELLPDNKVIKLPNDDGECSIVYSDQDGIISVRFNFQLNTFRFGSNFYEGIKLFFEKLVALQTKESIVLRKIKA